MKFQGFIFASWKPTKCFGGYFISSKAEEKVAEEAECDSMETFLKNLKVDFILKKQSLKFSKNTT